MRAGLLFVFVVTVVTAGCMGMNAPEQSETPTPDDASPTTTVVEGTPSPETTASDPTTSPTDTPTPTETTSPTDTETASPTATPRDDPDADRLGWEGGYWHNESISVNRTDGLNETELDAVVSRAMARVEAVRRLEFDERVPVSIISREQFRENRTGGETTTRNRLHQNTKWEAMFVVDEETDAIASQESNQAATVLGFYSPQREEIVIVSEDTESPQMNEITLSQELFHALQDQAFDAFDRDWYPGRTVEEHNAADGVIEGDGNYVDHLYEQRCGEQWDCLLPRGGGGGGSTSDINFGMFFVTFQPYSDGPAFVQRIHEREGWEGVNDLYDDPPESTEQVIHPEKYGVDEPNPPEIDHSPSNGWRVLEMGEGSVNYASFGEAGIATMFWYPSYVATNEGTGVRNVIVGYRDIFNYASGTQLQPIGPYNYNFSYSAGWDGDRLVPYVTNESAATNETGYVWKTNWDSTADASEFVAGYEELLAFHDAESVSEDVYRLPEESGFGDAISVTKDGDQVTIVNAPTVDQLDDVHDGAGPA